jgi:oxygen-independent coproporphyrinogen-3 oxidase
MYAHTIDRLARAGLEQYEISNFAAPGHESRHNLVYWANDAYFGVGVGAARYVDGTRAINTRDLPTYLRKIEAGEDAVGPSETLDAEGRARETAVLMLRLTRRGLEYADFRDRTGFDLNELANAAIERHMSRGWLEDDGRRLRLTSEGLFVADTVLADFL